MRTELECSKRRMLGGRAACGQGAIVLLLTGLAAWSASATAKPKGSGTVAESCAVGPPSLSGQALQQELRRADERRRAELAKLATLKEEIKRTRAALQMEIVQLEKAIRQAADVEEQQRAAEEAAKRKSTKNQDKTDGDPLAKKKRMAKTAAGRARLAKAFKVMPPKDAARLLKALEPDLAADLLAKMRPQEAGLVLAALGPRAAAALTVIVAGQSEKK